MLQAVEAVQQGHIFFTITPFLTNDLDPFKQSVRVHLLYNLYVQVGYVCNLLCAVVFRGLALLDKDMHGALFIHSGLLLMLLSSALDSLYSEQRLRRGA